MASLYNMYMFMKCFPYMHVKNYNWLCYKHLSIKWWLTVKLKQKLNAFENSKEKQFYTGQIEKLIKMKEMMIFYYYKHDNIQLLEKMADSESKQVLLIKKRME